MKYYVEVTELLKKVVSVEADSEKEARRKVEDAYDNEDIVLTSDDFDAHDLDFCVDQEFHKEEEERGVTFQHID